MLRGWGHQRLLFLCDVKAPYFPGDEGHHVVIWSPNPMKCNWSGPEEVRHASRNADSACPVLYWRDGKKGHAESAFRGACATFGGDFELKIPRMREFSSQICDNQPANLCN